MTSVLALSTMAAEDETVQKKPRFKITTKGIRGDYSGQGQRTCEKVIKVVVKYGQNCLVNNERNGSELLVKPTKKRGPEEFRVDGVQKGKIRRRMDRTVKLYCGGILKDLMSHPKGWIFNEPVDPLKWNIPDYFSIIKKPMDLGTIKSKLEENLYFSKEDFADDVRLTFYNAMLYNPPADSVHVMAKFFNDFFSNKWKSLEAKLKTENADPKGHNNFKQNVEKSCRDTKQIGPTHTKFRNSMPMSLKEKDNIHRSLSEKKRLNSDGHGAVLNEKRCALSDDNIMRTSLKEKHKIQTSLQEKKKLNSDGPGAVLNEKRCTISLDNNMRMSLKEKHKIQTSFSEKKKLNSDGHGTVLNEKRCALSFEDNMQMSLKKKQKVQTSLTEKIKLNSDGPGAVPNEERCAHLSTPVTNAVSVEGWSSLTDQLSPKRALRAAMLKSRFASTIVKATHQDGDSDPVKLKQERERLEREQLEEKARIEKEMKAVETAMLMEQAELKMQLERKREAARMAIQKIEKSVNFDDNFMIFKELELLCRPTSIRDSWGCCVSPLARLGLYLKEDDYLEEEEEEEKDEVLIGGVLIEEGEIL